MRLYLMFVTAVCVLFLIKLIFPLDHLWTYWLRNGVQTSTRGVESQKTELTQGAESKI